MVVSPDRGALSLGRLDGFGLLVRGITPRSTAEEEAARNGGEDGAGTTTGSVTQLAGEDSPAFLDWIGVRRSPDYVITLAILSSSTCPRCMLTLVSAIHKVHLQGNK